MRPFHSAMHAVLLSGVCLLAACGGSSSTTPPPRTSATPTIAVGEPAPGSQPLPFAALLQEDHSGITQARNVVIRDAAALEQLWNAHYLGRSSVPPLPQVDFQRSMVVGVFTGTAPIGCRSVEITAVTAQGGKIVVEYEISQLMTVAICMQRNVAPMALVTVDRFDGGVEFVDGTPHQLPFTSVDLDANSAIDTAGTVVARDAASWTALWARHKARYVPTLPPPEIDFSRYMVIGVFAGSKPNGCHGVSIASVSRRAGTLYVTRVDRVPAAGIVCTQAIVAPAHLIMIERGDEPVVVAIKTVS